MLISYVTLRRRHIIPPPCGKSKFHSLSESSPRAASVSLSSESDHVLTADLKLRSGGNRVGSETE